MTEQLDVRTPATARSTPVRTVRRVVAALLVAAAVGGGLWFLTPSNLGGSTTYLAGRGTSMLPTHEPGVLILARAQDEYAVGDLIAFHSEERGYIVLHRIVGIEGDRYVTRGDNNTFDDAFRPDSSHVVGTPWIHIPHGADGVARLRSPVAQGVAFGALAAFAFATVVQSRRPALDRRPATRRDLTQREGVIGSGVRRAPRRPT